jgi:DNA-directed RNA polymerase specialized sigma24 family protein
LYKSGYTIEEIARELRIPAGEIKFMLNFSNISKT